MQRVRLLATVGVTALIGVASSAVAAGPAAASTGVVCTKLSGSTANPVLAITGCPKATTGGSGAITGAPKRNEFTVTWRNGKKTTFQYVVGPGEADRDPVGGKCPSGTVELEFVGKVVSATNLATPPGSRVRFELCGTKTSFVSEPESTLLF